MQRRPILELQSDSTPLAFPVGYLLNVGYAGRNLAAVQRHIDELAGVGVKRPRQIPTMYPVSASLATTAGAIQVQHGDTSGEVEYVLLVAEDEMYVTVGSDHSDRALERTSVPMAKQAYPNVVAPRVWRFRDVEARWDDLIIRSWMKREGDWLPYQEGALRELRPVDELLALARRVLGARAAAGLVLFSGTIAARGGLIYGEGFRIQIEDPSTGNRIEHEYAVEVLPPALE